MRNKSIPSPVENLEYIKCYSLSSPILGRNPGSFIKCNCQNFCSYLRKPKTILEIRRKTIFVKVVHTSTIYKFSKDFSKHRKKINRWLNRKNLPFIFKSLLKEFIGFFQNKISYPIDITVLTTDAVKFFLMLIK